jgi:hypothetical protein
VVTSLIFNPKPRSKPTSFSYNRTARQKVVPALLFFVEVTTKHTQLRTQKLISSDTYWRVMVTVNLSLYLRSIGSTLKNHDLLLFGWWLVAGIDLFEEKSSVD